MIMNKLGIDQKDAKIISYFSANPSITQKEISKRLGITQPSVNMRIQNLVSRGILKFQVGVDFKAGGLYLARVDFTSRNANNTIEKLRSCTFFVNGFMMSGKNNVSVFLVAENLRKIDEIVKERIKSNPENSDVTTNIVVSSVREFPVTINLEPEFSSKKKQCCGPETCGKCRKIEK
jgi:DNA-binding Lrp family transcriptional regulator